MFVAVLLSDAQASYDITNVLIGASLWTGFAALSIALLILGRTRWGQVKPISKCVVLSLLAHLLLFALAYTVRGAKPLPGSKADQVATLRVVDWTDDISETAVDLQDAGDRLDPAERPLGPWESPTGQATDLVPQPPLPEPLNAEATTSDSESTSNPVSQFPVIDSSEPPEVPFREYPVNELANVDSQSSPVAPLNRSMSNAPLERTSEYLEIPLPEVPALEIPLEASTFAPTPSDSEAELSDSIDSAALRAHEGIAVPRVAAETTSHSPLIEAESSYQPVSSRAISWSEAGSLRRWLDQSPTPLRLGDGAPLPELYRLRLAAQAGRELPPGATVESEEAVRRSLRWMADQQEPDGRWDASRFGAGSEDRVLGEDRDGAGGQADTAITALVLLSMLGHGETHLEGEYREQVQHGLEFLIASQGADGNLFGEAELFARMYSHGIATIALAEATAMTGDPRLHQALGKALEFTRKCQDPQTGGWRYRAHERGDMSQFGWQVMALRAGEQAGFPIPESTRLGMHRFLDACSSGTAGGRCSYRPGEAVSPTMTAEGLACRFYLNYQRDPARIREALDLILRGDEGDTAERPNLYFLYYAALAMQQYGGPEFEQFNPILQERLQQKQLAAGPYAGTWEPGTRWGGYGGRMYSTAMATLCLEVPYRHLPLYRLDEPLPTNSATNPAILIDDRVRR